MTSPTLDRRQGLVGNTAYKAPVACVAVAPLTLSGEQLVGGVQTAASRVLVAGQANTADNGIYDSSTAAWTRSADADGNYDLAQGSQVAVAGGPQAGTVWRLLSDPGTIGTSPLLWSQPIVPAIFLTPNGLGAVGDGVNDDTTAWNLALSVLVALGGGALTLESGNTYKITKRIQVPSGIAILGDGTSSIFAPAASFNNTSLTGKYADNSCVLDLSGQTVAPFAPAVGTKLSGFVIESEVLQGRLVDAVVARNVKNVLIERLNIFNFPVGCGVRAASLIGGEISKNRIHDFTDNATWASQPQITGIEIDQDRVNGLGSAGTRITENEISNITVGSALLATWGYQTDGINIANPAANNLVISGNRITMVGEGIDHYGSNCALDGNVISFTYNFGLKLIHGASNNAVSGGSIYKTGIAGILLAGSPATGEDVTGNAISGVAISEVDYLGVWLASNTACIAFELNGGVSKPSNNVITGCSAAQGQNGQYGWYDETFGSSNFGEGILLIPGVLHHNKRIRIDNAAGLCRPAGSGTYSTSLV